MFGAMAAKYIFQLNNRVIYTTTAEKKILMDMNISASLSTASTARGHRWTL
jgi:hypothetical protein